MSIVRRFARPLLASSFILSGVERLRDADSNVHLAKAVDLASKSTPQLSVLKGQERLVGQALAGAQVLAGALFALGKFPRFSSAVLLGAGATNAYIEHQAAEAETAEQKFNRRRNALSKASLLGAIAITAVDTDGNPSLVWRANKLAEKTAKKSSQLSNELQEKAEEIFAK